MFTFYSLSLYQTLKYESYVYPAWANALGWLMALTTPLTFPVIAAWVLYNTEGQSIKEVGKLTAAHLAALILIICVLYMLQKFRSAIARKDMKRRVSCCERKGEAKDVHESML